jgi:hypothetical protein
VRERQKLKKKEKKKKEEEINDQIFIVFLMI